MNRLIVSAVIVATTVLGVSACSEGSGDSPTPAASATATAVPTTADPTTPAVEPTSAAPTTPAAEPTSPAPATPAADTSTVQSVTAACMSLVGPMLEASQAMSEIASATAIDAQSAVDSWSTLVDAYRAVAETVVNPEVKAAATALQGDLTALRDAMQKVYVEQDMGAMSEFMDATAAWEISQTDLQTLCTG